MAQWVRFGKRFKSHYPDLLRNYKFVLGMSEPVDSEPDDYTDDESIAQCPPLPGVRPLEYVGIANGLEN